MSKWRRFVALAAVAFVIAGFVTLTAQTPPGGPPSEEIEREVEEWQAEFAETTAEVEASFEELAGGGGGGGGCSGNPWCPPSCMSCGGISF